MKNERPLLLVEDDEIDVLTFKRALKYIILQNHLYVANDGEDALKILRDDARLTPCLILLDLNMPKMTGLEFLKIIKHDHDLKQIPVVIVTTSKDERDKVESFELGVAGYMVKPVDYHQFVEVVRVIDRYWTLSELP
jgi:CheY-like chemotaxis protein